MDIHGGSLSVFSEGEGYGSTFTLELNVDAESRVKRNSVSIFDSGEQSSVRSSIPRRWSVGSFLSRKKSYTFDSNQKVHVLPSSMDSISHPVLGRCNPSICYVTQCEHKDDNANNNVYEWKAEDVYPPTARLQKKEETKSCYSVLMVDDSVPTRRLLSKLLQSRCRKLDQAGDGVEALCMVEVSKDAGDPYDVILMDSEMPNMNGPSATRLIREQLGYKGLIIGVTGNALPDDIANFKDHGADDVLVKPLKINQFDEVLNKINCKFTKV